MKSTRWCPDSCNCDIEFGWTGDTSADPDVVLAVHRRCEQHQAIGDMTQLLNILLDESRLKENVRGILLKKHPELAEINDRGEQYISDKSFLWKFNEQRELEIDIVGITKQQKKNFLDESIKPVYADKVKVKEAV